MSLLDTLHPLLEKGQTRTYNAGSTILYQGEVPRSVFVLKSGVAKSFNISHQGEEQIVNFHVPGNILAPSWVFEKTSGAVFFYEAVSECEVVLVRRSELHSFIGKNQQAMNKMLDMYVTDYTASLIRVSALEQAKAVDKVLYTLYYLCRLYGDAKKEWTDIEIKLTHQDIASLVGLTRETVAVEINKLRKKKLIQYSNQHYSVHVDGLLEMMGEDSFKSVTLRYSA